MTYEEFIANIIETRGQWSETVRQSYCERHHIIPKCLGGQPNKVSWQHHENIIWLTPQEHFIAHTLLARENIDNDRLVLAWCMMAFPKGDTHRDFAISPEEYADLRIRASEISKNRIYSAEQRKQMSIAARRREDNMTEEQKQLRRASMKETWQTKYTAEERSLMAHYKNVNMSEESKQKRKESYQKTWKNKSAIELKTHAEKSARHLQENGAWDKHWYNNGIYHVYLDKCPDGYVAGIGKNTTRKPDDVKLTYTNALNDPLFWTDEQRQYLIANYQIISLVKIAEYLNKAYQDVKLYANKLKKIGIIQNENTKRRKNKN